jgi:hypothetical protein
LRRDGRVSATASGEPGINAESGFSRQGDDYVLACDDDHNLSYSIQFGASAALGQYRIDPAYDQHPTTDEGEFRPRSVRVQILNVAALLPTRDWKPQMPNAKSRRLTMFSHVVREPVTHQYIGSRPSDPASERQDLGGARVIAATAINAEVPISAETMCRSIETKGA